MTSCVLVGDVRFFNFSTRLAIDWTPCLETICPRNRTFRGRTLFYLELLLALMSAGGHDILK